MSGSERSSIAEALTTHCKVAKIDRIQSVRGGCINQAFRYDTDQGKFFVKVNDDLQALDMFRAESIGLQCMADTKTVLVPYPIHVGQLDTGGAFLIMEYVDIGSHLNDKAQALLGERLAKMHLRGQSSFFGFEVDNTIGSTPQINTFRSHDWVSFYSNWRLKYQLDLIKENYRDDELYRLGMNLKDIIAKFFPHDLNIEPALLHGDLWSGNAGILNGTNEPVIFDPACYYGHNEAELSIMKMFGGFTQSFFKAYHEVIPKHEQGFQERHDLYQLYHYLNHYNLFGSGYRSQCMSIIRRLLK